MSIQDAEKIVRNNIEKDSRILTGLEYKDLYVFAIKRYEGDFGYDATVNRNSGVYDDHDFCFSTEAGTNPEEMLRAIDEMVYFDEDFTS